MKKISSARSSRSSKAATTATRVLEAVPRPREETEIPNDATGACAYLAVMCYPGTDERSHVKRNVLVQAIFEYIRGILKYRVGNRRASEKRSAGATLPLLRQMPTMRNREVYAACNRAERILRVRRFSSALVLQKLRLVEDSKVWRQARSALQIKVGGEQRISGIIEEIAVERRIDERRMWAFWKETQPVLHLVDAFSLILPLPKPGDRPQILIRSVICLDSWLAECVRSSESRVRMEMLGPHFRPELRVSLSLK